LPFKKGQSGNPKGRPTKAKEQKLVEKLGPLEETAHEQLKFAVQNGERWAIEMYFGYMYGKPTQRVEQSGPDGGAIEYEIALPEYTDGEVLNLAEQVAQYREENGG
jgi:hypothetical protein